MQLSRCREKIAYGCQDVEGRLLTVVKMVREDCLQLSRWQGKIECSCQGSEGRLSAVVKMVKDEWMQCHDDGGR